MASEDPVLLSRTGHAALLTLNRPRALNALTHRMVGLIDAALTAWQQDDSVRTVVVSGAGTRGLCAGGDIRAVREDALQGGRGAPAFWRDEYRLNARIARYPKPYVAFMDGIVMGGGVGISAHGGVRIVTERSRVAMPETGIGLVPDVGGTFLLSRSPGELGTHLALTGAAVGAADAILCKLADHVVRSADLPALTAALGEGTPRQAVRAFAAEPAEGELAAQREWIDVCYAADDVEEIVARLLDHGHPAAKQAAETILTRSPTALKATLAVLRAARQLPTLEAALDAEYRATCAAFALPDLPEGVRAQIVDKDRRPRWTPARLHEVGEADVARFFAEPEDGGLGLAAALG
ncbi:enoyl-CoA hydratase/isomerase family protein [Streptomyces sp. 8L]|uniref:enoyl-CoA hydratase/isomerase family protein n=1 Tax=Streptomyces sp. 8L TaxID=2877242 RepID=UPI001CD69DB1|nr:enoyl-CoA hydratase/isomerase family protein [Streptomyces sp. 8L]MCA1216840.1 enoyl-CoA hydratase/isomerase family protein [Streptomyces sp. 8L]